MRGIEPPSSAWEADILPINYIRIILTKVHFTRYFLKVKGKMSKRKGGGKDRKNRFDITFDITF